MANGFAAGVLEEVRRALKMKKEKEAVIAEAKEAIAVEAPEEKKGLKGYAAIGKPKVKEEKPVAYRGAWEQVQIKNNIHHWPDDGVPIYYSTNTTGSYFGAAGLYGKNADGSNKTKEQYEEEFKKLQEERDKIYREKLVKAYVEDQVLVMIHPTDRKAYKLNENEELIVPLVEVDYILFSGYQDPTIVVEEKPEEGYKPESWLEKYAKALNNNAFP